MKRSSVEPWIENVGETGCHEPAFKQNTNNDDDETLIFKWWHKQEKPSNNSLSAFLISYPILVVIPFNF